jgi:pyridinium-3,5-biscarboxylic acid mononucleotide synthase
LTRGKKILRSTRDVLEAVKSGELSISKADQILKLDSLSIVDDVARLDINRFLRRGVPEIIYARNKSLTQLHSIVTRLLDEAEKRGSVIKVPIIASKLNFDQAKLLRTISKSRKKSFRFDYFQEADIASFTNKEDKEKRMENQGRVALLSAGTSDIAVLNESEVLLKLMGVATMRFNDVGVASLKRLVAPLKGIQRFDPDAVIVAAGMEAALPSVIAGLSSVPIIGLPTSVGFGYGRNGEAALMSMLQACPLGICVVNIDGGVAAGIIAWLIARRSSTERKQRSSN